MDFEGLMDALFTSSILSGSRDEDRTENSVQAALENGDVAFMQRLIKIGGILLPMNNDAEKLKTTKFVMQMLL